MMGDESQRIIIILSSAICAVAIAVALAGAGASHKARKANCADAGGEYVRNLDICVKENGTVIVGFDR